MYGLGVVPLIHAESLYVEETENLVDARLIVTGKKVPTLIPKTHCLSGLKKKIKALKSTQLISQVFNYLLSPVTLFIVSEMFQMHL